MIEAVILSLLCLALASVVLRVLFFLNRSNNTRLAKITSIAGTLGFLPLTAFAWVFNIAMLGLLLFMLAYWMAPERVTSMLDGVRSQSPRATGVR